MKAKVEFEQTDGSWLADGKAAGYISENEFELEKVTAGFDGEDGDAKRPDVYRNKIVKKITNHEPFMTSESDIQYAGGNGNLEVEINESNTVWTYKVYRKTFTVTLNTTDADGTDHAVSSVAETVTNTNNKVLKYRYGQKPANNPTVTNTDAYKFKEWQLDSATFNFDGTYELTKNINVNAVFDINIRTATLNVGNVVADNITYPVEDGVTADYSELNTNGTIKLTIRGDKLKPYYELKPLNLTGTIYDKVTHQPLALDNDDMYSDTKIYDNITVNVKSKPNLDKFKGFYPQYKAEDSDNKIKGRPHIDESESLGQNLTFNWNYLYYKGHKYEHLGDEVFKYSLVELEDSKLSIGKKQTKKLIDAFTFVYDDKDCNWTIGEGQYDISILKPYIEKVMYKKMNESKTLDLPYINGNKKWYIPEDGHEDDPTPEDGDIHKDGEDYKSLKHYWKNQERTEYNFYFVRNIATRNFFSKIEKEDRNFIATATEYWGPKSSGEVYNRGFWGFKYDDGLLFAINLYHGNQNAELVQIKPLVV